MTTFVPLPAALGGERVEYGTASTGRLSAYIDGSGPPLLLVHSVNAAASAAEVRPLHDHYRASRTVVSIDLPGYGFSERSDRVYTPRLMTDALHATLAMLRERCGPLPVDGLALSLSCEFLARAAAEAPRSLRSLALVSPTGFMRGRKRRGPPGSTLGMPWLLAALRGPGGRWGNAVFRGLTKPGVIRYFLRRTWGSQQIDETLWAYDVVTARQPHAEFAPLHFVSAGLFSADIHTVYEQLALPVWMVHGVRGDFTDYRGKTIIEDRPNWHFDVLSTGALPHFEQLPAFCGMYDRFLAGLPA